VTRDRAVGRSILRGSTNGAATEGGDTSPQPQERSVGAHLQMRKLHEAVLETTYTEWLGTESNRRHADFQSAALPTELPSRGGSRPGLNN
jgi:hypothetical protein